MQQFLFRALISLAVIAALLFGLQLLFPAWHVLDTALQVLQQLVSGRPRG